MVAVDRAGGIHVAFGGKTPFRCMVPARLGFDVWTLGRHFSMRSPTFWPPDHSRFHGSASRSHPSGTRLMPFALVVTDEGEAGGGRDELSLLLGSGYTAIALLASGNLLAR